MDGLGSGWESILSCVQQQGLEVGKMRVCFGNDKSSGLITGNIFRYILQYARY